jgi:hypothetical protein
VGNIVPELSPSARVIMALLPFAIALFMRVVLGNSRFTRILISASVLWFAAAVLMAPYSSGVRTGIRKDMGNLRTLLP